jgi:hypothetical protein
MQDEWDQDGGMMRGGWHYRGWDRAGHDGPRSIMSPAMKGSGMVMRMMFSLMDAEGDGAA